MDYTEFLPSPALAPVVERIWTLTASAGEMGVSQPVLPDGRPELVMHFGDRFDRVSLDGETSRQATTLFAGQLTEQLTLKPSGAVAVLGVRFRPYGAWSVLRIPQHHLTGMTLDVEEVDSGLARALRRVRDETEDVMAAVPLVQKQLERWIADRALDPRLAIATRAIVESDGLVSIENVAARVALTRRQLERRFLAEVGIAPKRLARITRFQRALRVLDEVDTRGRGALTAAACGYADQAHFIREFRQLAGCSPSEHLLTRGEMTGFFVHGR
jgi:AraC-like DNA-binding protein